MKYENSLTVYRLDTKTTENPSPVWPEKYTFQLFVQQSYIYHETFGILGPTEFSKSWK